MATLSQKERRDLYSSTMERLTEVIGASGKAEELVKLTTQIVQAAKKLVEGTPDAMKNKSTITLAEFVIAAKKIAQDTRAVDSVSLQKLSSTRKAVELLLKEIDGWHTTHSAKDEISLDDILRVTASQKSRTEHRNSLILSGRDSALGQQGVGAVAAKTGGKGSPIEPTVTEQEKKLVAELKKQQDGLMKRAEPQTNPSLRGNPEEMLKVAVAGLSRSASQLMDQAGERTSSKETLLEPTITLAKMVSILMDIVDTLFVNKFPMRSQVHSFCCMLVDNVLAYGDQSMTEDAASIRLISTQVPAMMSALEVMVEQCFKRAMNIQESQQMSLQRKADLHNLDVFGPGQSSRNSPASKRRKEPPIPPGKKASVVSTPQVQEFEICVTICTSVGVDSQTKFLLNKGAEIMLKATSSTTVRDVREMLKSKTSLPLENIQLRFRGDDVMADDTRVTPDNPIPYFMFNLHEPGEEDLVEFRRDQRRKNRLRIDTKDWSRVPSSVAVAVYDYEALAEPGEEDNLEFAEGDLIEIIEQSADGWWTGKVDGSVGVFPASFVEMIQIPKNKDERKRLLKRYQQGRLGEQGSTDINPVEDSQQPKEPPLRPPDPKIPPAQVPEPSSSSAKPAKQGLNRVFSRSSTSSDTSDSTRSPSPTKAPSSSFHKLDRKTSDPQLSPGEVKEKDGKSKKRLSLFKKKPPSTGGYMAITDDFQRSPILSHKNSRDNGGSRPGIPELEEEMKAVNPPPPVLPAPSRPLFRPKSSPRLASKGPGKPAGVQPGQTRPPPPTAAATTTEGGGGGGDDAKVKRRPPPPPPPYAKTYGPKGMHKLVRRLESDDKDEEEIRSQTLPLAGQRPAGDDIDASPLISMTVTPASPVTLSHREQDEGKMDADTTSSVSSSQNNEMEDLLKNLEEFNEFSSTPSLTNDFKKAERDYATIPRDELPIRVDDEDEEEEEEEEEEEDELLSRPSSVPAPATTPTVIEDRPCLTPNPRGSTNTNPSLPSLPHPAMPSSAPPTSAPPPDPSPAPPPPPPSSDPAPPVKPPRSRSKRMRLHKELEKENSKQLDKTDPPPSDPPPPLPKSAVPPPPPSEVVVPPPSSQPSPPQSHSTHPAPSPKQQGRPVFRTPKPPSSHPPPLENGLNREVTLSSSASTVKDGKPKPADNKPKPPGPKPLIPVVPPRNKRSLKRSAGGGGKTPEDVKKPPVANKPRPPQMTRTQLEVTERLQCSSAPGSRTSSPDDGTSNRLREGVASSSTSNLSSKRRESRSKDNENGGGTSSPLVHRAGSSGGGGKSTTLLFKTAMKCISYLSSGHLVREEKLMESDGNQVLINKLLTAIDNSEEVDLNSLQEAPSVLGLLVALFGKPHLGHLVHHELANEMSSAVQSADPISVLGSQLDNLAPNYRELIKNLLRFFGKILKYSHKNLTEVEDIDKKFGSVIFENIPSLQSEPLLAYLISTCEFL